MDEYGLINFGDTDVITDIKDSDKLLGIERSPHVTSELILHLRNRREWQNRCPPKEWTLDMIQRNIGANEVIMHLEELLEQSKG
ncbi:hypothetical protein [Phyllobacterium endophyticum]|uniref:hypothetical protein n=1 Tax=Phyllobacterium endophyticum TaxID=1149773 RepID=UPI0011C98477|nr:hypothetical protein [Phyllobacterium endophyticum]TXR49901.1 hypothetical protein FVA77_07765 [Phyllobacterium endophyticum]